MFISKKDKQYLLSEISALRYYLGQLREMMGSHSRRTTSNREEYIAHTNSLREELRKLKEDID